ncbi:F-box only protein 16 [Genypterus blacodes]|uniref:F-box only protein 16 n=1 Tax=Genypterus blacodes TaxID=154954 RepID=UPI003F7778CA
MPLAVRSPMSCPKMDTKLSAWTPLNHTLSNSKVFAERRNLLAKWFDRWSHSQRKAVLQDFVLACSMGQLRFLSLSVSKQLPLLAADFTCLLPRALCLYLFSFLDPRSLCRCAQVSWHWKSIVELDQLWMPKCVRLGWCISFSPTPFEQGVWKRHYIQSVQDLGLCRSQQRLLVPDITVTTTNGHVDPSAGVFLSQEQSASVTQPIRGSTRSGLTTEKTAPPPWRGSDRRPKDTQRFNYLDNLDPNEQARQAMNIRVNTNRTDTATPGSSKRTLTESNYKLRKAKSLMFLSSKCRPPHPPPPPPPHHQNQTRPDWATHSNGNYPVTKETAKDLLQLPRWNAGVHPRPVRSAVPRLSEEALRAMRRSHRSAPSKTPHSLHFDK